jgi:hypothetical protein
MSAAAGCHQHWEQLHASCCRVSPAGSQAAPRRGVRGAGQAMAAVMRAAGSSSARHGSRLAQDDSLSSLAVSTDAAVFVRGVKNCRTVQHLSG